MRQQRERGVALGSFLQFDRVFADRSQIDAAPIGVRVGEGALRRFFSFVGIFAHRSRRGAAAGWAGSLEDIFANVTRPFRQRIARGRGSEGGEVASGHFVDRSQSGAAAKWVEELLLRRQISK